MHVGRSCFLLLSLPLWVALFSIVSATTFSAEASPFTNLEEIIQKLAIKPYYDTNKTTSLVKIAILDNGFRDYQKEIGKTLPTNTTFHIGKVANTETEESHGLFMAQMLSALLTNDNRSQKIPFELHLYSSYGFSNFAAAIDDVIAKKIDIVLYSQVWEYGGSGNGQGFINQQVNRATGAGVLWVNAAGNFQQHSFSSNIKATTDNWVELPGANQSVHVRCKRAAGKTCQLRAVLSWNDYKNDINQGTNKDLDLVLTDDTLKILQTASLTQTNSTTETAAGSSKYPREILQFEVKPGLYFLRVKVRSQNFDAQKDRLRISLRGDDLELLHHNTEETLLNPADNSSVITVGASDSELSSESVELQKPEIKFDSSVFLSEKEQFRGSSNSAAIIASAIAAIKSLVPQLTREQFLNLAQKNKAPGGGAVHGLSLQELGFAAPLGRNCFPLAVLPIQLPSLKPLLRAGAVVVMTSHGVKVFTAQDPFALTGSLRQSHNDALLAHREGFTVLARTPQNLPQGVYEIVQLPKHQKVCEFASFKAQNSTIFAMPNPADLVTEIGSLK